MTQTAVSHWNRTAWERDTERIMLLHHEESQETLESLRENVMDNEGQFISLNLTEPMAASLPEMLYSALKNTCWDQALQFSLPVILQHNPHVASPFINRAILWQRLCDLLIIDDAPYRETVLVLENVDLTSQTTQHEIARLIRFHEMHSLHRSFVFTLNRYSHVQVIPELWDIFGRN